MLGDALDKKLCWDLRKIKFCWELREMKSYAWTFLK